MSAPMAAASEHYWGPPTANGQGASTKEIFSAATRDAKTLARQEADLAKVEVKRSLASAGRAGALFTGGGLMAFLALQALTVAAGFGLATVLPVGIAFLVVGVAYLLATGVLVGVGRKHLSDIEPPRRTIDTVKDDIRVARAAFTEGMHR